MNSLIVVGGGAGKRMKSKTPKIFLSLAGKPILMRTLSVFREVRGISEVVLVLPRGKIERVIKDYGIQLMGLGVKKIASGGATRQESVCRGLEMVDEQARLILVHDAARPLVTPREVRAVMRAAHKSGAALLGVPVRDTLKKVSSRGGKVKGTVAREGLWRAQTPQVARSDWLYRAHEKGAGKDATDDCELLEMIGKKVVMVEGSERNIKITAPEDVVLAEMLLEKDGKL